MKKILVGVRLVSMTAWLLCFAPAVAEPTTEVITFKGVPLDDPRALQAVRSMCLGGRSQSTSDCTVHANEEPVRNAAMAFNVEYGPIKSEFAYFWFRSDGSLIEVEMSPDWSMVPKLVEALTAKYGAPSKVAIPFRNSLNLRIDLDSWVWSDSRGSRITIRQISPSHSYGRLAIISASIVASEKVAVEAAKDKL